jgi:hypothetical protein
MTTTGCQHDNLGSAPTGTVCKDCGANWTQILRDCPALRKPGGWDVMALGFGAFKGTLEYLLTTSRPEGRDKLERVLLDTVRGICRGAECPIGEDGTPFEGPFV